MTVKNILYLSDNNYFTLNQINKYLTNNKYFLIFRKNNFTIHLLYTFARFLNDKV